MCVHNPMLYMWGCPACMSTTMPPPPPEFIETIRRHAQRDAQEALALDGQIAELQAERQSLEEQVAQLQDQIYMVNRNLISLAEDRRKYPPR
jgi:septal ring factor EnvC (AmiA/AmiB activator)